MNTADGTIEVVKKKPAQGVSPLEMFLYGDRYLIVINAKLNTGYYHYTDYYGYDRTYSFNYDTMVVNIYDLEGSSGDTLRLHRSDEFRGTYKTSRLTGGSVYLISNYTRNYNYGNAYNGGTYKDYFNGASAFDIIYTGENGYYYSGYLIAKLDLEEEDARGRYRTALYADKEVYDIYCSPYAFYTMKRGYIYNRYRRGWSCRPYSYKPSPDVADLYYYGQTTDGIDRISLDTLERTGTVSGFNGLSPDRFCLYDNGEYLFVANQKMYRSDKEDERGIGSYLYVYGTDMNEAAFLGPLAPGEKMFSARLGGDTVYIVTAKRAIGKVEPKIKPTPTYDYYPAPGWNPQPVPRYIDPLFKIDISNPLEPAYLGELEIEGFSSYMQGFGDGFLLGLGRGADGSELKISLFDVSGDVPSEVNSLLFEGGAAEAESEARAILCEPDRNVFAFAARYDEGGLTQYGTLVLGLDDGELTQTAFLPEIEQNTDYSRKRDRRAARIGGWLLTVSDGYIVSYLLSGVLSGEDVEPMYTADTRIDKSDGFHTVKFVTGFEDDGISYSERFVENGYYVTLPIPADIEGEWQFGHWSSDKSGKSVYYNNYYDVFNNIEYYGAYGQRVSYDITLYAKWYKLPFHNVDFNLNAPAGKEKEIQAAQIYQPYKLIIEDSGKVKSQATAYTGTVIDGYKLAYWYASNPSVPYDFNAPVTSSFTLYAYWQKVVTHTVTFDYNFPSGARYSMTSENRIVEDGAKVDKPQMTTCFTMKIGSNERIADYQLEYWYIGNDSNTAYNFNQPVTGNITLKAKWKVVKSY